MHFRTLAVLALAGSALAHRGQIYRRQDIAPSDDGSSADPAASTDGGAPAETSAAASPDPAASTDPAASASAVSADPGATTAPTTPSSGVLGGAGSNGAIPVACVSCEQTYELVNKCSAQVSSESCSPICSNYTATVNCLDCLITNGQQNLAQSAVQQVVWDIEAECSMLGVGVATQEIVNSVTATGPFTTIVGTATAAPPTATGSSTSHSGITDYATTTRSAKVTGSIYTSFAVDPSNTAAAGHAARQIGLQVRGIALFGAVALGAVGIGAVLL